VWKTWTDKVSDEIVGSDTLLAIELTDVDAWLFGTEDVARSLVRVPPVEVFEAGPI